MISRLFDIARVTGWTLRIRIVDAEEYGLDRV